MSKRNFNVFFNTHTVSGIVISIGLYIIFFAGAFSFFREEIDLWQRGELVSRRIKIKDLDQVIKELDSKYKLHGRDIDFNFRTNPNYIIVNLGATKDTINNPKGKLGDYFFLHKNTFDIETYTEHYGLSEFLYRLHFLDPIYYPIGRNLAGFIALFFLFAIITGVIIHWKKIISNFFVFNPKGILKNLWADSHTALGVIGLPFQFMYGVTGAFFIIGVFVLLPANLLFGGDEQKLRDQLKPGSKVFEWLDTSDQSIKKTSFFFSRAREIWGGYNLNKLSVSNYGGKNMKYIFHGEIPPQKRFVGKGRLVFDAYSSKIIAHKNPRELNYLEDSQVFWKRLHYADFGGIWLKVGYFIFAILTCFVIITGVLIWIEARNKKSMTDKQRLYTAKVGWIYLAICLSMLPVIAICFIFARLTNGIFENPRDIFYAFYFIVWFVFIVFYSVKKDNYFTNKNSLLLGSIFGFLVPIINGFSSGNWFWEMYKQKQYEILTIDVFWIVISFISLLFYLKIKPSVKDQSSFSKNPIDIEVLKSNIKADQKLKIKELENKIKLKNKFEILMKTKIVILWIFLGIGWIVHHLYGLFGVYYNESLMMEGATGEVPLVHHAYRIAFEGFSFLFGLLSLELSKKWFVLLSLSCAVMGGLYNFYHLIMSLMYECTNYSEIFMLILMVVASCFLIINLNKLRLVNQES